MKVFERPGPVNTDEVVAISKDASLKVDYVVIASITGDSAVKIAEKIRDKKIVCVTCPQGMHWQVTEMNSGVFAEIPELRKKRDEWRKKGLETVPMNITPENRNKLAKLNVEIVRGTIPLFGPSFSMRLYLKKTTALDIVAKTLELISPGTLVCMETVLMATDAGVIPEEKLVLACAGTEMGLDTAWILKSCASANMFHPSNGFRFVELLAKPGIALNPSINITYLR
jgi:uncharacterized protein